MNTQSMAENERLNYLQSFKPMLDVLPGVVYIIDTNYKVVSVNESKWNKFAVDNEGEELTNENSLLGSEIFDSFTGKRVKEKYKQVYDSIFTGSHEEFRMEMKCHSPEILRDTVLFLTPIYDPQDNESVIGILHQSVLVKTELRDSSYIDISQEFDGVFTESCSICKFVKASFDDGHDEWLSFDRYLQFEGDDTDLEQSVCDDCSKMLETFIG